MLARRDYLPFGANNARTGDGYDAATDVRQRFADSERDLYGAENESYADFMQARYLAGRLGRFYSPDEVLADQHVWDPGSWNLYAYARNNPVVFSDPSGRAADDCVPDPENGKFCSQVTEKIKAAAKQVVKAVTPDPIGNVVMIVSSGIEILETAGTVADYVGDWLGRNRNLGCLAGATATGSVGGGLMGLAGGPGGVVTVPGGFLAGGMGGYSAGMVSCMSGLGSGSGAPDPVSGPIERHHLLPQKFKDLFKRAGLDIEDFVLDLSKARHRLKPDGLHTGHGVDNWNGAWKDFFKNNPNATRGEILSELGRLRTKFGI